MIPGQYTAVECGQTVKFTICAKSEQGADVLAGIHVFDQFGEMAFATNTQILGLKCLEMRKGRFNIEWSLPGLFPVGRYTIGFSIEIYGAVHFAPLYWDDAAIEFEVIAPAASASHGYVRTPRFEGGVEVMLSWPSPEG